MQERNITVTLEKAKEWYNSGNATLKEVALQAFSKEELNPFDFTKIKTFEDAKEALGYSNAEWGLLNDTLDDLKSFSKASAAMFQLNIIRRALNKGYNLHLIKDAKKQDYTWYPYVRFCTADCDEFDEDLSKGSLQIIGRFTYEGTAYNVVAGDCYTGEREGLGNFNPGDGVGFAKASTGFLNCASDEIAEHFGLHFGMLIMQAMYGDLEGFEIVL